MYKLSLNDHHPRFLIRGLATTCVNTDVHNKETLRIKLHKIIRIVRALSLVNRCVYMRVLKHGCDITRILRGYVVRRAF